MDEENTSTTNDLISNNRFPPGMIALMIYLGYTLAVRAFSLSFPILIFGPFVLPRTLVIIYYSTSVIITGLCLWSVFKRIKWGRLLITFWYGFGIIYVLTNSVVALCFKEEYLSIFRKIFGGFPFQASDTLFIISGIIFPLVSVLIINTLVIWYVNKKKEFFVN